RHSLLWYDILPGPGYEKFRINLDSRVLLIASLDRETQEVFSIKENQQPSVVYVARAADMDAGNNGALRYKISGSPSRSSTALLYITVLDKNDHSPLFEKNHYHISVRENLEEGTAILGLFASDRDDGPNGKVMHSLTGDTFGAFAIDSVTGSIVATEIDSEMGDIVLQEPLASEDFSTQLIVMASDQGTSP
ncbi:hypothetical protein CIB84_007350, partial [Bambusicola thoracicus]